MSFKSDSEEDHNMFSQQSQLSENKSMTSFCFVLEISVYTKHLTYKYNLEDLAFSGLTVFAGLCGHVYQCKMWD